MSAYNNITNVQDERVYLDLDIIYNLDQLIVLLTVILIYFLQPGVNQYEPRSQILCCLTGEKPFSVSVEQIGGGNGIVELSSMVAH